MRQRLAKVPVKGEGHRNRGTPGTGLAIPQSGKAEMAENVLGSRNCTGDIKDRQSVY